MKTRTKAIQKHHKLVRFLRMTLPLSAAALLLCLVIWPQIAKKTDYFVSHLKGSIIPRDTNAKIDMKQVQFFSEDDKGQPFTVTSSKVLETDPVNKIVQFSEPVGKMTLNSGVKLTGSSPTGLFYQDTQIIVFEGAVFINADNGYTAQSKQVTVDYKARSARSNAPTQIRGEKLDLDASGFEMRQSGDEVDFFGGAKAVLKDEVKNKQVIITADGIFEVRQKTQTITARKNVLVDDQLNKIWADEMTAYFRQEEKNKYKMKSVQAHGNVRIKTATETIYGNDAFYDLAKEKAFITGSVIVKRAEGEMQGDRAVIDMKSGHSQLEVDYSKTDRPSRVKGTIYPTRLNKKEK